MQTNLIQSFANLTENQKHLFSILLIFLVTLSLFANSLSGEFIFDDFVVIQDNPNIKSLSNLFNLFLQSYWGTEPTSGNYRPLTNVSFALNFAISGSNPYSYHLVNILLHSINCCLIYWLCYHYCQTRFLSLICALFFSIHPVHSEAVAAIYSRPELLATMFLLIAWLCYLFSTKKSYFYYSSLLSYFLSLLCKESGISLIGILLLEQICLPFTWKLKSKPLIKIIGYIPITMIYLLIRIYVTQAVGFPKSGQFFANENFWTRLFTMSLGYLEYFVLLVWPAKLYTEYDYSVISRATYITPLVGFSLILILVVLIIGFCQIKKNPLVAFAVLFFFVTTSIVSNIIIPTGILIAERTIYLPGASVCLLLATLIYKLYKINWQKSALGLLIVLLALGTVRCYYRNLDFQSDLALFSSMLKFVPNHTKGNYGLGLYYEHTSQFDKAEVYLKKALELSPNSAFVNVAVGNLYSKQGQLNLAMPLFKRALELDPNNANAHNFYGAGLLNLGSTCEAKMHLKKAINLNKLLPKAHNNLGIAYAQLNLYLQAQKEFEEAIKLEPEYFQAKENLKLLKEKSNTLAQAIDCPEEKN